MEFVKNAIFLPKFISYYFYIRMIFTFHRWSHFYTGFRHFSYYIYLRSTVLFFYFVIFIRTSVDLGSVDLRNYWIFLYENKMIYISLCFIFHNYRLNMFCICFHNAANLNWSIRNFCSKYIYFCPILFARENQLYVYKFSARSFLYKKITTEIKDVFF